MVMEAVAIKVAKEDERLRKAAKEQDERETFKKDRDDLKQYQ